ncbi:MAG: hypothetical protein ACYDHG_08250 [Desulfomonilaceae bacterium]
MRKTETAVFRAPILPGGGLKIKKPKINTTLHIGVVLAASHLFHTSLSQRREKKARFRIHPGNLLSKALAILTFATLSERSINVSYPSVCLTPEVPGL